MYLVQCNMYNVQCTLFNVTCIYIVLCTLKPETLYLVNLVNCVTVRVWFRILVRASVRSCRNIVREPGKQLMTRELTELCIFKLISVIGKFTRNQLPFFHVYQSFHLLTIYFLFSLTLEIIFYPLLSLSCLSLSPYTQYLD